jgi:hypothetical protein
MGNVMGGIRALVATGVRPRRRAPAVVAFNVGCAKDPADRDRYRRLQQNDHWLS